MGTFPVKVDIPEHPDLCTIDLGPLNFDMANAFTDFYKRAYKSSEILGKSISETVSKMNKVFNGEGDKNDMKKSTEAKFYTTDVTYLEKIKCCDVDRIIFNPPATIVFWKDGSKTVVKCHGDQTFNPYYGFCAALAKHIYKSNSAVNRMVDKYVSEMTHDSLVKYSDSYTKDNKKTNDDGYVGVITNEDKSQTVNSLQYDHNLGRVCENCKYYHKDTREYPCNRCTHIGLGEASFWTSDSKKKDKKADTSDTNSDNIEKTSKKNSRNVMSLDDDYVLVRFCDTCKYRNYHNSNFPCRECIHTGKDTGISYWTEQEDK